MAQVRVVVTDRRIDKEKVEASLLAACGEPGDSGARVTFVGTVRGADSDGGKIESLTLEHYPGMTERALEDIAVAASKDHGLMGLGVQHRYGTMEPGETIVAVVAVAKHRTAAFDACRQVVERLKTDVPFWKKETGSFGGRWVGPPDRKE